MSDAIDSSPNGIQRRALVRGGAGLAGILASGMAPFVNAQEKIVLRYLGTAVNQDKAIAEKFKADTGIPVFKWSVADYDACVAGIAKVEGELGPVEILVNNAGITRDAMFHKMTPEQWREVIDTNLSGVFNMTHPVWNGMRERKFGRIVTISSINAQKGQAGQANYSAAKAGDLGFTKALAQEGARAGITVNAICPGYIATDMVKAIDPAVLKERVLPQIPVGRLGEPEEVARCVVFLASDAAGFITGSTLSANGGQFVV